MHHTVRFSTPFKAMLYAAHYNPKGVRIILAEARKAHSQGTPLNLATLQFCFAFAAIQGYPVTCFYKALVAKGICI